jgi:hypothetical protein
MRPPYPIRLRTCHPGITAAAVGCGLNRRIQGISILFISSLTFITIMQTSKKVRSRPKIFNIKEEEGTPLNSWITSLLNFKRNLLQLPTFPTTHRFTQRRNSKLKERWEVIFSQIARHLTPNPISTENMKIITVIDIIIMGKMTFFKNHRWIGRQNFRTLPIRTATSATLYLRYRHHRASPKTAGYRTKRSLMPDHNSFSKIMHSSRLVTLWCSSLQTYLQVSRKRKNTFMSLKILTRNLETAKSWRILALSLIPSRWLWEH